MPQYSFTVPATFVRFTVKARTEANAWREASGLGEEVHDMASLARRGVEVVEISFADPADIEHDGTPAQSLTPRS